MRTRDLVKFIKARERHHIAKEAGHWKSGGKPDPIISQYRFCNVRRNDDRVTKWIFGTYLSEWRNNPDLWFALVVARLFNNESTLASLGLGHSVLPFKPEKMRGILKQRKLEGRKNFNAAYIVSTAGANMDKIDYVIDRILVPAWEARARVSLFIGNAHSLEPVHTMLMTLNGLASFVAAQVVADLKYADPGKWGDFHTFAASGPGSKCGLNRVMEFELDAHWAEGVFRRDLSQLRDSVNMSMAEPLTAQDVQNCLCEFDKYERVRLGEGRPKQLYKPKEKN